MEMPEELKERLEHKLSVKKLIKELASRASVLEDDGKTHGYPSTPGLLITAALVLDDKVLGDSGDDVLISLAELVTK